MTSIHNKITTMYSCPRIRVYTILETIFVYNMFSMIQHLGRFYGCCCENGLTLQGAFSPTSPHGE